VQVTSPTVVVAVVIWPLRMSFIRPAVTTTIVRGATTSSA
jgi:hypothetical protein